MDWTLNRRGSFIIPWIPRTATVCMEVLDKRRQLERSAGDFSFGRTI